MNPLTQIKESLLHLFYPHTCAGCGTDALPRNSNICVQCIHNLPATGFETQAHNPITKLLAGRIRYENATALFYFTKESVLQNLMHEFKYRGNIDLGRQLGIIMGNRLLQSQLYNNVDVLVPLPLYKTKEHKRGYNQAAILCNGVSEILNKPIIKNAVIRNTPTETQTKKNRVERWQNMEGRFTLENKTQITGKHVLLVDDVITTGATIEACAATLLNAEGISLSIATLCYTSNI